MNEEQYSSKMDELTARIPTAFHSFVRWYSWQQGHANGHEEVLSVAEDLVQGIESSLRIYKNGLTENADRG